MDLTQRIIVLERGSLKDPNYMPWKGIDMPNQLLQDPNKRSPQIVISLEVSAKEKRLLEGFTKLAFDEGLRLFNSLKSEHDKLSQSLSTGMDSALINVDRVKKLSDEVYAQGLDLLTPVLNLSQELTSPDSLKKELEDLLKDKETCSETLKPIVEERIDKVTKNLSTIKGYRDRVDELFARVGLCKDSIQEIRLEIPELLVHKPKDEFDKVLLELDTRIGFAKRLHEEYSRQGV